MAICQGRGAIELLPAVGQLLTGTGVPVCTGTLISPRHVLTAAHCGAGWFEDDPPVVFHVRIDGTDYELDLSCGGEAVVDPGEPGYPGAGFWPGCRSVAPPAACDLAVCTLVRPIDADPAHPELAGFADWLRVRPTHDPMGFGMTPDAQVIEGRDVLQIGCGRHLAGADDPDAWKRSDWNRIDRIWLEDAAVVGPTRGTGTLYAACGKLMKGDSGGPLVLFEDGRPMVVGVVAAGPECANAPDQYALVGAWRPYRWLRDLLAADYAGADWLEDSDADRVPDSADNCPERPNPRRPEGPLDPDGVQPDGDGDGWGDVCDNCPTEPNPDQTATDVTYGPIAACPGLRETERKRAWDGTGDACDVCPSMADTMENTNRRYEDEFGIVRRGDACDPDPVVPRVLLEPRWRRPGADELPVPRWCSIRDGYSIRFATYGFDGWGGPTPPEGFDADHRSEPVRLLWCSCWDVGEHRWLPELRPGEVPVPGVRYCNCGEGSPCREGTPPSTGTEASDRTGWFDFTNYEWNPVREVDETSTSELWRPCVFDSDLPPGDWDGDARWNPLECLPLKYGVYDRADGVQFRRNGVLPLRNPRMHEVRWRPDREEFAPSAPPIAEEPHRLRLWLRPEPGRAPGELRRDGGWSGEANAALAAAGVDGQRFNNTYRSQRAVGVSGSLRCMPPGLEHLARRPVVAPVRACPPGPWDGGIGAPAPNGSAALTSLSPAVVVVPIDEAAAPLEPDGSWLRFAPPSPQALISGIAVVVLDAGAAEVARVLPSRSPPDGIPPSARGMAFAQWSPPVSSRFVQQDVPRVGPGVELPGFPTDEVAGEQAPIVLVAFGGRDAGSTYSSTLWLGVETTAGEPVISWGRIVPQTAEAPAGREDAALFLTPDGGRAIVVGGRNEQGTLGDVWTFDFRSGIWQRVDTVGLSLPGLAQPRAGQLGEVGYLVEGVAIAAAPRWTEGLWRVDLSSGAVGAVIAPGAPADWPRAGVSLAMRPDGRLLVYGGSGRAGSHNDLWVVDTQMGWWSPLVGDCTAGRCPPVESPGALLVHPASGEPVLFPSPFGGWEEDWLFVWRGDGWAGSRELAGLIPSGDCDGDTRADARVGQRCAAGRSWWAVPGTTTCDVRTATPACVGGSPAGSLAAEYRVPAARALVVSGRTALVGRGAHLEVIDLSDAWMPRRIANMNAGGTVRDIAAVQGIALLAAGARVAVVDLSRVDRPAVTDRIATCGVPRSIAASDLGRAVVLCDRMLDVLVIEGPSSVRPVARVRFARARSGDWAVAESVEAPGAVGESGDCGEPRFVEMEGTSAFVVLGSTLMHLDLSRAARPVVAGMTTLPFVPEAFRVAGGFGYLVGPRDATAVADCRGATPVVTGGGHDVVEWVAGVEFGDGVACRIRHPGVLEVADVDASGSADPGGGRDGVSLPGGAGGGCGR